MGRFKGFGIAAALAASVVAWSGNAFAQAKIVDGPEVRWKLAAWGKPRAATQNVETLKKFMDERTGGKFKIQIGYESFGQPKELLDLLKVGSLEMTNICASYHPEKLPVYSALDLPFLPIPDLDTQEKVHLAFHKNPLVVKEFAGWNAMPYLSAILPTNEFVGRGKAPKTVEDFKGMRVRAIGGIGDAMRKLGAVPTSVDATEVYTSLERGTVDAAAFPTTYAHQSYRTYEVGKWYTENMNLGNVGCPTLIHVDRWAELPPAIQGPDDRGAAARARRGQEGLSRGGREEHPAVQEEAAVHQVHARRARRLPQGRRGAGVGGMGHQARGPGHPRPRTAELPAQGSRFAEILSAPIPRDRG